MRTTNVHGAEGRQDAEMAMDDGKLAEVEALALSLGNVLEACKRYGVSRSMFYKWLALRRDGGTEGGEDVLPSPRRERRRHPHALPDELPQRVLALAREYPEWGCDRISHYLKLKGSKISPTTIQKILTRNGLRTRGERAQARDAKRRQV